MRIADGFSLIEMVVVTLLIAMLAGVGLISVRGPIRNAQVQRVVSQWTDADAQERRAAKLATPTGNPRKDPAGLRWDSVKSTATFIAGQRKLQLPQNLDVQSLHRWQRGRWVEASEIRFNRTGQSETYAVAIGFESGPIARVVFSGISGQATKQDGQD